MTTFRVEWVTDVEAETPEEAARKAREYQWPRPGYWCGVFEVCEHDNLSADAVHVDLDELDQVG